MPPPNQTPTNFPPPPSQTPTDFPPPPTTAQLQQQGHLASQNPPSSHSSPQGPTTTNRPPVSNQFSPPGQTRNQPSPSPVENSHNGPAFPPSSQRPPGPFNPPSNALGGNSVQNQPPPALRPPPADFYNSNGPNSAQFSGNQPQFSASGPGNFPPMGSIPPGPNKQTYGPQTNHFNPPQQQQQQSQFGPIPPQNQFNQPPLNKNQYGPPPLSSGQNQFGPPPLPGQPPLNPNNLANQMQGMNLSGPRQYPGALKSGLDGGPHMPPPLSQQQQNLVNGQQLKSPQTQGYPPMPGQGGMQGAYPQGGAVPGGYPQSGYQQAQQRRLDPDQMPSPVSKKVLVLKHLIEIFLKINCIYCM